MSAQPLKTHLFLFDIDGTLIASGGAGEYSMRKAVKDMFGVEDGLKGVEIAGRTDHLITKNVFQKFGAQWTPELAAEFLDLYLGHLAVELPRNRLSALSSDFVSSLALARTEAARAGLPVLVLPATGGVTGNEFAQGWNLYLDRNSNGTYDSGDTLVRTYPALPGTLKLQGTSTIQFTAIGYLTPAASVTFVLCPSAGSLHDGVQITVPPNGLADVTRITTCT